jgi:hypothetical protein
MAGMLGIVQINNVNLEGFITRFPDDEGTNGSQNVGSLATQPPDAAASPRKF